MKLVKPRRLQPGDRIMAVTLSWGGPGRFPHRYEAGKRQFMETFGIEVVEAPNALKDPKFIDSNPKARADDLMKAFSDKTIAGIISTIGGDDSLRILPYLDLNVIRENPKVFMGYSDTTVSHLACFRAGLGTFYGPSFMAGFAENGGIFEYLANAVRRSLMNTGSLGEWQNSVQGWTVEHLDWSNPQLQQQQRKRNPAIDRCWIQGQGKISGRLLGGCAEVLEFLKGTAWWPSLESWDGACLFLETSEEASTPRQLLYWLRNYGTAGILERISALLFGRPGGNVRIEDFSKYDEVLSQAAREFGREDLPIVTQLDFGHTDPMFVLPYGAKIELDCTKRTINFPDAAVMD